MAECLGRISQFLSHPEVQNVDLKYKIPYAIDLKDRIFLVAKGESKGLLVLDYCWEK